MASFLILFSTFFFIFFTPQTASSAVICKTSYCGGGENPDVKFPFRLKHSPEACGYPGFDLSCNNRSQTILSLPYSGDFVVRDISYLGQSIFIGDQENCLFRRFLQNFSLSGSPFQFESFGTFTFFNCSANATEVYGFWPIPCLSGDDYVVFIAQSFFTQTLALPATCRAISRVPLPDLRLGSTVQLNWAVPICQGCEEQRGDCAIKNNTSLDVGCFNVPSNTGGLPRSANYGIAIGLGVPGILSVIGVSCYLCGLVRIHTRRRRLNTELSSSITLQRNVVSTGLNGPTIESYPKTLLGESRRLPKPNDNTCPICLSEYQPKEELRTIPDCHHYFHAKCVDEWLRMNATCPLCRNSPDSSAAVTPSSLSTSSSPSSSLVAV